ncbi:MAG: hypothetical protein NT068_00190 [Candidatus Nomurabacteria bacterium]|nr:hypothetical protein [Candidatus Nomurabacteria bacterium]
MSLESKKHGPVHHLGTPMSEHIGKLSDDFIPSDKGESTNPDEIKKKWKGEINAKLRTLEETQENMLVKYQVVKSLLYKFALGTLDKGLLAEIGLFMKELEGIDKDSLDFEPSMEDLIDEIEVFSEEYLDKFMEKIKED